MKTHKPIKFGFWRHEYADVEELFREPALQSILSGTLGAVLGSNAQSDATNQNAANIAATNQLNYQMFLQGRGSEGSAILPLYAKDANGNLIEPELFNDTMGVYDATGALTPDYQKVLAPAQAAAAGADQTAANIFNGGFQTQELNNLQPVAQARTDAAVAQKSSTLEALQQTLNNIKAIQAGKGYSGDSFGNQLLKFSATRDANNQGANLLSQANLANATDVNRIKANNINRAIANVNLPGQIASQDVALADAPSNALLARQQQRLGLFSGFRIAPGAFTAQNMPTVQPNSAAFSALSAAGAAGSNLGAAYLKNPNAFNSLFGANNAAVDEGASSWGLPGGAVEGASAGTGEGISAADAAALG